METLVDVAKAIRTRRSQSFKNLRCYVVNYFATSEFPHKFFYNGCCVKRPNGTFCTRSTDALERCEHNSLAIKHSQPMYRFQLQVTDRSPSPPVHVTIFYQASHLLGVSADKLSCRSEEEQLVLLKETTSKGTSIDVYLKVKPDNFRGEFVDVVSMLFCPDNVQDELLDEVFGTPTSSPAPARSQGIFHTPRGEEDGIGLSSGSSSSLQRTGGKGCHKLEKLSNAKSKVIIDLIQVIDLSNQSD